MYNANNGELSDDALYEDTLYGDPYLASNDDEDNVFFIWKEDCELAPAHTLPASTDWHELFARSVKEITITSISGEFMGDGSEHDALPRGVTIRAAASVPLEKTTYSDATAWDKVNRFLVRHAKCEMEKMEIEGTGVVVILGTIIISRRVSALEYRLGYQPHLQWRVENGASRGDWEPLPASADWAVLFQERLSQITIRKFTNKFLRLVPVEAQGDLAELINGKNTDADSWEHVNTNLRRLVWEALHSSNTAVITLGVVEVKYRDKVTRARMAWERLVAGELTWLQGGIILLLMLIIPIFLKLLLVLRGSTTPA